METPELSGKRRGVGNGPSGQSGKCPKKTLSGCSGCTQRTTNKSTQSAPEEARESKRMTGSEPSQLESSGSVPRYCEACEQPKQSQSELPMHIFSFESAANTTNFAAVASNKFPETMNTRLTAKMLRDHKQTADCASSEQQI